MLELLVSLLILKLSVPGVDLGGVETVLVRVVSAIEVVIALSFGLHTGTKFVLISTAVCNIGFEICKFRKFPLSGFGGPSKLLSDEVGDKLLLSSVAKIASAERRKYV